MFDFRYHALSLMAVFLALGIGILLGVTIGDSLVSDADQRVRSSLRDDVIEAREAEREARGQLARRERLISTALPSLARDRLRGRRVAAVGLGGLPEAVESSVRAAVELAGGRIDSVSIVEPPRDIEALADALGGGDRGSVPAGRLPAAVGGRIGTLLVRGGRQAQRLRATFPERFRGDYRGASAVVAFRAPPPEGQRPPADPEPGSADEAAADQRAALEAALMAAVRRLRVPLVGVEESGTDPSQIPFFADREASSVDSVDLDGGRLALIFTLAGARGSFGFKPTAEAPLPPPPAPPSRR